MASPNNNLNVLPWYTSLTQQNSNKWYAFGNVWPLVMPVTRLVPYQFVVPYTGVTVSSSQIINMETGRSYSGASHAVISRDSYSVIQSAGTNFSSSLPEGRYYGRITLSNGSTYYSEIFTLVEDMSGYIKIQYWNDDDMYYQGGEISYSNSFRFEMYLCTTIGKPEYNFEEEVTSRLGYKFPELQVSNKVYKFTCVAPEFICDAMRLIRMSDYIQITDHYGEVYNALTFAYEAKWETQGDVASVEAEFETDNIIQKLESFNRRVRDSFYNALLTDTEEALKFDEATVAQYYNDYMSTFDTSGLINGKMIRELVSGEGVTDTTYIAVDYGVGTAKKLSLKTILGGVGGGLDPEAMWAELKKENSDRLIHPSHFGLLNRMFTALDKDGNEVPFDDKVVVEKDENGETVVKDAISSIRANYDFWGVASVSAKGKSTGGGGGGGGGGLIQTVYGFTDFTNGTEFSADDNSSTFNAYAINELYKMAKEGGGIKGLTVTGDGNVLTGGSLSADGKTITLSKNYTAISQQDGDARYAKKGDTVTRQMISKLFTALSADGTEVDITTDEAISSIRANYDFWGVASVSAKGKSTGGGGGGGGASALYQLADVLQNSSGDGVSGASEGKALVFDGSHWYAADAGLNESQLGAYLSLNKYLKQVDADGKYALKTIRVSAGTGLTGGGSLNTDVTLSLGESGVKAGTYTKVTTDIYGRVTKGEALAAADVPSLDWSKITTGKPNTLSGYGIIDAYTRKEANEEFVTVSSGQTVTGAKTFTREMRVCGIAPLSDLMYDIGSASRRIRSMYSKNAEFTESVRIGDILLVYDATNKMVRVKYKDDTASGGLYTDGSLSAKGASTGGGGGGGGTLDGLLDVNIQNAADKQILVYNALQGKWVNSSPGSGLDAAAMWAELQRADSSKVIDISHIPVSTLDGKYVKKAGDTMTGDLIFNQSSATGLRQIRLQGGDNDYGRIAFGGTDTNAGWMEIATADDATEPIYVRQYTGVFTTLVRAATLLDGSGNTQFPGTVQANYFTCRNTTLCTNLNADLLDGIHETSFLRYRNTASISGDGTLWSQIGIKQYNGVFPDAFDGTGIYRYGAVVSLPSSDARLDIWYDHNSSYYENDGLLFRSGWADDKKPWRKILDNVNYIPIADARYVRKTGDTMTGPLNFANGTINTIGDDCRFGDYNEAGCVGFQGNNGVTGISLLQYNTVWDTSGNRYRMTWNGSNMSSSSTALWDNLNADLLDGYHGNFYQNVYSSVFVSQYNIYDYIEFLRVTIPSGQSRFRFYVVFDLCRTETGGSMNGRAVLRIRRNTDNTASYVFYVTNFGQMFLPELRCITDDGITWKVWMKCVKGSYDPFISVKLVETEDIGSLGFVHNGITGTPAGSKYNIVTSYAGLSNGANFLVNSRTINGTSFNGTASITTSYWGTARTINGTSINGSTDYVTSYWGTARGFYIRDYNSGHTGSVTNVNGSSTYYLYLPSTINASLSGNASSATALQTSRTINGTGFNGTANITTSYWGTTRTFYINSHDSYRSGAATNVNGSGNVTLYLPNSIRCNDWFRSTGSSGWYNDTYGGGIYMHDSSWVRVFGGKRFYVANADNTDFSTISALSTEGGIHAVKNITTNANMFARGNITAKASSSDIRLKTDIQPYNAVGIIKRFRSVKYHWNDTAKKNSEVFNHDGWNYGLIAQDLIKGGFGQWVKDVFKDYYTIDYERIIPVLWKGVQEVDSEVSRLRREVACLRKRIYNLEKRIRA